MHKKDITKLLKIQGVLVKNIDFFENSIKIYVETKPKHHICPCCNSKTKDIHDYYEQKIQHIKIGEVQSYIILQKRRYVCKHCKKRFYENYNFLQKYFRKSNAVFETICANLKQLKNFKTIAQDNNVSIPTIIKYMHYACALNNGYNITLPQRIGIDEFKGNCNHTKYQFHIFDLDTGKTIDILESRTYDFLEKYFSKFSLQERLNVKLVSMDMYAPFKRLVKDKFPSAIIVADTFHFTRIAMNPLDDLRLNLWRNAKGKEKYYFRNIKNALMKDASRLKEREIDKLLYAFEQSPILKEAYKLTQQFLDIKKHITYEEKENAFRNWLYDAECSTISEFKSSINSLRQWHEYISNSFKYKVSNGPVEGKNNLIKTLKRISFGFKNLTNFRDRILLCEL